MNHPAEPELDALDPGRSVPTSGTIRMRVRYCECDPQGLAHHSSFVPWMEEGRTQLVRDAGISYACVERAGLFLVVSKLEVRYRAPVRYDDVIEVRTTITGGGRARIDHAYEIVVVERATNEHLTGAPAVEATTTLACVGTDGRPTPLPEWLAPPKNTAQR